MVHEVDYAELPDGWLDHQLSTIDADIERWSQGLKDSYASLFGMTWDELKKSERDE